MGVQAELTASCKPVLSPLLWNRLESTPYGRNMDPDGNYIVKPVDQKLMELQKSHIPMDHYGFPRDRQVDACKFGECIGIAHAQSQICMPAHMVHCARRWIEKCRRASLQKHRRSMGALSFSRSYSGWMKWQLNLSSKQKERQMGMPGWDTGAAKSPRVQRCGGDGSPFLM